jgi:hypothetical protein
LGTPKGGKTKINKPFATTLLATRSTRTRADDQVKAKAH